MFRIVQIGSYPLSGDCIHGGVEASVFGLSQEQSRNADVHVFDIPRIGGCQKVERDGCVMVHRWRNNGNNHVAAVRQVNAMAKEILTLNPNVCHIHGTGLFSWLIYRALKKKHLKVVVTVHGLIRVEKKNALQKKFSLKRLLQYLYQGWVENRFLSKLPAVIVDTEYVREKINAYPLRKKPEISIIPQGIKEAFFSNRCSKESRILLSVGAMGERKGHLLTMKAFERLRQEGIKAELVIVGTVAENAYLAKMQQLLKESEFDEDMTIRTNLPAEDLINLYGTSHLFVLHSEEESQGIVFAEAMATGMPVVSTRVGGIPYVVEDKVTGLLSEYGSIPDFAAHLKKLMTDDQLWESMSEASRIAANAYHWEGIALKVYDFYNAH